MLGTAAPVLTAPSADDEDDEVLPFADVVELVESVSLTWLSAALRAARYVWFVVVSWYMSVVGMLLHWPMGLSYEHRWWSMGLLRADRLELTVKGGLCVRAASSV